MGILSKLPFLTTNTYWCEFAFRGWIFDFTVFDIGFWCCTFNPNAVAEHMQRNAKNWNFFQFSVSVLHLYSPCGIRAHVAEMQKLELLLIPNFNVALLFLCDIKAHSAKQVPSPCKNWNFQFHGFQFLISVLHFRSLCDSRVHVAECAKWDYFRFPI